MKSPAPDQFERLVRPHMRKLFRTAYRWVGDSEEAKDLVQDACIAAYEHLGQLADSPNPLPWLMRVLYNRFIDGLRRRQRSPVVPFDRDEEPAESANATAGAEDPAGELDGERCFARAWGDLEQTQRALLALSAEGYAMAEISAITGIALDVLGPRLHRARRSLRRNLERLDNEHGAVARAGSRR